MSVSKRMKDKSKIIESPNSLRKATKSYNEDDINDFEEWELPAELQFIMKGYLLFTEQDLLEALMNDGRFDVENTDSAFWAAVCAARKDRR
jgi:hypothetical protein